MTLSTPIPASREQKVPNFIPQSTAIHMDRDPVGEVIALFLVFVMQEKNIILLEKYGDATIQVIYEVGFNICSIETDQIAKQTVNVQSLCDIVACQFQKTLDECDRKRQ